MPFYSYKCISCDYEKEILQAMDAEPPLCEKCDLKNNIVEMKRVFKSVGKPLFKGDGFYETDYKVKDKP